MMWIHRYTKCPLYKVSELTHILIALYPRIRIYESTNQRKHDSTNQIFEHASKDQKLQPIMKIVYNLVWNIECINKKTILLHKWIWVLSNKKTLTWDTSWMSSAYFTFIISPRMGLIHLCSSTNVFQLLYSYNGHCKLMVSR